MIKLLLLGSCVILTCILCNRLTSRIGVPMLFAFILLGMLFGSEGIIFRSTTLLFRRKYVYHSPDLHYVLRWLLYQMEGGKAGCRQGTSFIQCGYGSDSGSDRTVLPLRTGLLAFSWKVFLGAVLGSTDAASVFSVLRSKKLSLKNNTDSLLEVESGSNDPFAYMLTIIILL